MSITSSEAYLKPAKKAVFKAAGRSSSGSVASCKEAVALSLFYKGPSMNPVLNSPDVLHVVPYDERRIRCGDVVVFRSPDGGCNIVHRVVSINTEEIRTKGDNNGHADSWVLKRENIMGRVDWIERGDTKIRIYGVLAGRTQAVALKLVRALGSSACCLLRPLYVCLAQNRVLKRWFTSRAAMRIISLNRPEGEELQLLVGQRVIGRRPAGTRVTGSFGSRSCCSWTRQACRQEIRVI